MRTTTPNSSDQSLPDRYSSSLAHRLTNFRMDFPGIMNCIIELPFHLFAQTISRFPSHPIQPLPPHESSPVYGPVYFIANRNTDAFELLYNSVLQNTFGDTRIFRRRFDNTKDDSSACTIKLFVKTCKGASRDRIPNPDTRRFGRLYRATTRRDRKLKGRGRGGITR